MHNGQDPWLLVVLTILSSLFGFTATPSNIKVSFSCVSLTGKVKKKKVITQTMLNGFEMLSCKPKTRAIPKLS